VSFGLKPAIRQALNSVFLHECVQAGLDSAIVHSARILPMHRIDERAKELCLDLVYDRRRPGYDPLHELIAAFADIEQGAVEREDRSGWPVEERLKARIVDGDRDGLQGDVHDIGKNLVDIILTNNGYEVKNLGIKVPIHDFVEAVEEFKADAVGMSGLLVKSTLIMRENLEELNSRGLEHIPVLLGGAALTRSYVERDLREVYKGRVFYGKDAFEGLRTMETLMEGKRAGSLDPDFGRAPGGRVLPPRKSQRAAEEVDPAAIPPRSAVALDNPVFEPPFLGARVAKGIPLDDIAAYLNETALFRNQWQFRPEGGESDEEFKARIRPVLRAE